MRYIIQHRLFRSIILLVVLPFGLFFLFTVLVPAPPVPKERAAEVLLRDALFRVDVVETPLERSRGLSGRDSIPEFGLKPDGSAIEGGMLFQFEKPGVYSFWMKGMRFPIDILWLMDGRVVFIVKAAPVPLPKITDAELPVYQSPVEANAVLELNAGASDRFGIAVGDIAEIRVK